MTKTQGLFGSVVLAALLLQGCGGSSSSSTPAETASQQPQDTALSAAQQRFDTISRIIAEAPGSANANVQNALTLKLAGLDATDPDIRAFVDKLIDENDEITTRAQAYAAIAEAVGSAKTTATGRGLLSKLTDKVKDALVDVMDTGVGHKITSATFKAVLNDEGVTVFMLDQARKSETITQIMIDALGNDWSLTKKMCPMLQTNKEFGEKFAALADERDIMGRFFFEMIDAPLYNCLADAMMLSRDDNVHDSSVSHSTTAYMGILMDRYSEYFVAPGSDASNTSGYGRKDAFVNLLFDTGDTASYDVATNTFENHGDGNELINEKFFYALFSTPTTTNNFISAMKKVDPAVRTQLMDQIFMGIDGSKTDTTQGYLNIIAIGSAMYDGIYGTPDANGMRTGGFGFGAYSGAFIDFAGLIPSDRFMPYGMAFVGAGYQYAQMHGLNVWENLAAGIEDTWNSLMSDNAEAVADSNGSALPAVARSAGAGVIGSDWMDDILDLFLTAWNNVDLGDVWEAFLDDNRSVVDALQDQAGIAYDTVIDGRDANGTLRYPTEITNPVFVANDTVYGFHGLVQLAIQEDMVNSGAVATLDEAKSSFTLPLFGDLTWSFVYNSSIDGIKGFWNNVVDADWLANLSDNEKIREYFYPDADNVYIPNWLLAIDWLKAPRNFQNSDFSQTDFSFQSGYLDIYVVSKNDHLNDELDLPQAASGIKDNITMTRVSMDDDSIIAVDENGQTLDGLYVYKIHVIDPTDVDAVVNYLYALGDSTLEALGFDTSNAADVVKKDEGA